MTPEQKREQLLKRLLPGIAITVIYFVFISGIMSEKMHKAEEAHQNMLRQGISADALPGMINQSSQTQQRLAELKRQHAELIAKVQEMAGFLTGAAPSNESGTQLSTILMEHHIWVLEERSETFEQAGLSASLLEVLQILQPESATPASARQKPVIPVKHLWLRGTYSNMYRAMAAIAASDLKGAPVQLTMRTPDTEPDTPGDLDWELILWM
ncbi:MAG: hypothetical protein IBX56_00975 [Methylomicrobium sp.]|nr:hypothetical protein [Methylomicrobium sp.]